MKRKFLSVLLAASMALTALPATAWAGSEGENPAVTQEITELPEDVQEGQETPEISSAEDQGAVTDEEMETPADGAGQNISAEEEDSKTDEEQAETGTEGEENADSGIAAAAEVPETTPAAENVASVGDTGYPTLAEAVEAANGAQITLLADAHVTENAIWTNVNITNEGGFRIVVDAGASLTLKGSDTKISGTYAAAFKDNHSLIFVANGAALTVEDGTFTSAYPELVDIRGTANISGGTFTANVSTTKTNQYDGKGVIVVNGKDSSGEGAVLTMTGGKLKVNDSSTTEYMMHGLTLFYGGKAVLGEKGKTTGPTIEAAYCAIGMNNYYAPVGVTIYGGEYKTTAAPANNAKFNAVIYISALSEFDIQGGVFTAAAKSAGGDDAFIFSIPYSKKVSADLKISGGMFDAEHVFRVTQENAGNVSGELKASITGGTFTEAYKTTDEITGSYKDYIASGYTVSEAEDGWTVKEPNGLTLEKPAAQNGTASSEIGGVYKPTGGENEEGIEASSAEVRFDVTTGADGAQNDEVKKSAVAIPQKTAESLKEAPAVTIQTDVAAISLDKTAMGKVGAAGGDVRVSAEKVAVEDTAATKPSAIFDVKVETAEGETNLLPESSKGENGTITIVIPKTQPDGKVYYISVDGSHKVTYLQDMNATPSADGKSWVFKSNHLSMYAETDGARTVYPVKLTKADGSVATFETLKEAAAAATEGGTIELNQDVEIDSCIDISKNISIHGNGHTIKAVAKEGTSLIGPSQSTANGSGNNGKYAMFRVSAASMPKAKLTVDNVILNADGKGRVIYCGENAQLEINGAQTKITGGIGVTKDGKAEYIGGVYMSYDSELVMNGGEISGNRNGAGDFDEYLANAADLWIGNNAKAALKGGAVDKAFINATTLGGNVGGALTMSGEGAGATIKSAFVEAEAGHTGKVVVFENGKIEELLIAMDYVDDNAERVIVAIENPRPGEGKGISGLTVPAGETAVVTQGSALKNPITIQEGATLEIPAGAEVTVVPGQDGNVPAINNSGTLAVGGKLLAGAAENDEIYVNITGSGTIQPLPGGKIDLGDTHKTITITFNSNGGTSPNQDVALLIRKDGGSVTFGSVYWQMPVRAGYIFRGWYEEAACETEVASDKTISADIEFFAKWEKDPAQGGDNPHRPGGGGGGGASSSSSTITITNGRYSVKADVKISGGTAAIGKVDKLDKVIGDGVVSIDLSNQKKEIDTVKVDSSIVNAIANDEESEGMEIKLSDGTVALDANAVAAVRGGDLTIKLDKTNGLNSKQKNAVKDMDVYANYELTVNGTKALKDGKAEVRIPFAVPGDKDADDFRLYFVAEDGTPEEVSARFAGGEVRFAAEAFGDYVIACKAAAPAEPAENTPVAADCDGGVSCPAHKFTDVDTSLWYHKAVDYVITNGLMSGVGENTFSPNANLSRAMLAQILYNLAGRPAVTGTSEFKDVAEGLWYTNAIAWASGEGVVSGYGNGKFGPNDNITREQLAVMLYRYAGSPMAGGSLEGFADAGRASGYAQDALVWAASSGVMSGKGGGMLDPQGLATRAEVAQMLCNYLNK